MNIRGNPVSPPAVSLSNRTRACGGASRSQRRLGGGETGFPHAPPCGEGLGGLRPPKNNNIFILALCAPRMAPDVNIWGNQVSPSPCPG